MNPYRNSRSRNRQNDQQADNESVWLLPFSRFDTGRMLAWYALQQYDETGLFLTDILSDTDSRHELSSQERGLAVDVASGVVRRRRTLDVILESQISRPRAKVEPDLWRLLQLGVYQIVFSRAPDHAAVDTTVELARAADRSRWCGFANGVLRNITRLLTDEIVDQPGRDTVPLSDSQFRRLNQAIFPDPAEDAAEFIGQTFSLPRSLARRWTTRLTPTELQTTCFYSLDIPRTSLRVNRLASTVEQVQSALDERGVQVNAGGNDWSLQISHASRLTSLPGFDEGWWSVQDDSAMRAATLLNPEPGERILDLCAAPGGKSTQMAEMSNDEATIIACDVSEHRLRRIDQSIERLDLSSVEPVLIDRDGTGIPADPYDAVLVDVPCSNTGVLSRRPEARWRFRDDEVEELVQIQTRLLMTAFDCVRPGGRVVYSTCSIEPEETTTLIRNVCEAAPAMSLREQHLQLPGHPSDGAYQAVLIRDA